MPQPTLWNSQYTLRPIVHLNESGDYLRPTGYRVRLRRLHRTVLEYVERGTWLVECPHGRPLLATAGRFFVVPTDCPHQLTQIGPDSPTHWWMLSLLDPQGIDILQRSPSPWLMSLADSRWLARTLTHLRRPPAADIVDHLHRQAIQLSILERILAACPHPPAPRPQTDPRIESVLQYIHTHLSQRLSRRTLADLADLSPTRFHYVFLQNAGAAPTQYVITQRIQRARELLGTTAQSVKSIAAACGFADPARFSRLFHTKVGLTPLAYRRQFQATPDHPPARRANP